VLLLSLFAGVVLALAQWDLWSNVLRCRSATHEIGVRLALGAQSE